MNGIYTKSGDTWNLPKRGDYIKESIDPDGKSIQFHPIDCSQIMPKHKNLYGFEISGISLLVNGVLSNGESAIVLLTGNTIYLDCDRITKLELDSLNIGYSHYEDIEKKYGQEYLHKNLKLTRIYFSSTFAYTSAIQKLNHMKLYSNYTVIQKINNIIIDNKTTLSDWVNLSNYKYKKNNNLHVFKLNVVDYVAVDEPLTYTEGKEDNIEVPKYFKMAWDIEVYGHSNEFPTVSNLNDKIFAIGGGMYHSKSNEPLFKFIITYCDFDYNDSCDYIYIRCDNEKECLIAFAELIQNFNPEFREAFNNYNFDDIFVFTRMNQYKIFGELYKKMCLFPIDYIKKYTNKFADAHEKKNLKVSGEFVNASVINITGGHNLDIMLAYKRDSNKKDNFNPSNALNAILSNLKLPQKLDMDFEDMREAYKNKNKKVLKDVMDYCVVDGTACENIQNKMGFIMGYLKLSHFSYSKTSDCMFKAGGMKVKNCIISMGNKLGIIYTETPIKEILDGKYKGALVLPPDKGSKKETPTIAFDFRSLYPSIIITLMISPDARIENRKLAYKLKSEGYDVYEFHFNFNNVDYTTYWLRADPKGNRIDSVFPLCLEIFAKLRTKYKKMMITDDPVKEMIANQSQKMIKVLMNTFYGFTGYSESFVYNYKMSMSITYFGQLALKLSKEICINHNTKIIYGDTDSIFIGLDSSHFNEDDTPAEKAHKGALISEPIRVAINDKMKKITGAKFCVIEMNLDKILYPAFFMGKKKYFGDGWMKGFSEECISGLDHTKRGASELLIRASTSIIKKMKDFNYHGTVDDALLDAIDDLVCDIKKQDYKMFKLRGRNVVNGKHKKFIERMEKYNKQNPKLYPVPEVGTYFDFIVVDSGYKCLATGNKNSKAVGDRMEYYDIAVEKKYKIDYLYYFTSIAGALGRFIHGRFDDNLTDKEIQTKSKSYIISLINSRLSDDRDYKIIKTQHVIINKTFKTFIFYDTFIQIYNMGIDVDLYQYKLNECDETLMGINAEDHDLTVVHEEYNTLLKSTNENEKVCNDLYNKYKSLLIKSENEDIDNLNNLLDEVTKFYNNNIHIFKTLKKSFYKLRVLNTLKSHVSEIHPVTLWLRGH